MSGKKNTKGKATKKTTRKKSAKANTENTNDTAKNHTNKNCKKIPSASKLGCEYMTQEEQYVIRFPPEIAKRIRKMIKTSNFSKLSLLFSGENSNQPRIGTLYVGKNETYRVVVADLPCVVETHKTLDNRNYYKSGDIGQILLVQDQELQNTQQPYDEQCRCNDGLTPATKNIRKRKWRQRPEILKQEIKDAEAEIIRLQKGGVYTDRADIELIPVEDVDQIFETPAGNWIVTKRDGPPIRAGIPSTFTDAELQLLPKHHRDRINMNENVLLEEEDEDEDDEDEEEALDHEGEGEPALKKARKESPSPSPPVTPDDIETTTPLTESTIPATPTVAPALEGTVNADDSNRVPSDAEQSRIKELRTQKVNLANEIALLQRKNEQNRIILKDEQNLRMKKRIADKINKFNQSIANKKKLMAQVDSELAKYGAV